MAHFAKLDENNVVTEVIVIANRDTSDASGVEKEYIGAAFCERLFGGVWKQTSYNGKFRKRYAGIGYIYNADLDAFIPPKPFPSWVLNPDAADWEAPIPVPEDEGTGDPPKIYSWDEATTSWKEMETAL